MVRIALGVEYDGTHYSGWQRQSHKPSVQAQVEKALSHIANEPIQVFCAGRTDAGVHASGQIIHFDTSAQRPAVAWIRGANCHLPPDIRILWHQEVPADFDARKSAIGRRYCYIIANQPVPPGIMHRGVTWVLPPLDVVAMQQGAQYLIGEHDFSAFRAAGCQAKTPVRHLSRFSVSRHGTNIILDVTANAFLHHMVRNIAGSLIQIGQHKHPPQWIQMLLAKKDRRLAAATAAPNGLYLVHAIYPNNFDIPAFPRLPWFLTTQMTSV